MSCCPGHKEKRKEKQDVTEKEPKTWLAKWLYKVGKEDYEKQRHKKDKGCH